MASKGPHPDWPAGQAVFVVDTDIAVTIRSAFMRSSLEASAVALQVAFQGLDADGTKCTATILSWAPPGSADSPAPPTPKQHRRPF